MGRTFEFTVSRNKLILIAASFILFVGGSAYGFTVGNNPNTGYLLCANQKTHMVIYPAKLSCPSGYSNLALGAQGYDGQDGQPGLQGPQGLQGVTV